MASKKNDKDIKDIRDIKDIYIKGGKDTWTQKDEDEKTPTDGKWTSDGKKEEDMLQYVLLNATVNEPEEIIAHVDQFCWEQD